MNRRNFLKLIPAVATVAILPKAEVEEELPAAFSGYVDVAEPPEDWGLFSDDFYASGSLSQWREVHADNLTVESFVTTASNDTVWS